MQLVRSGKADADAFKSPKASPKSPPPSAAPTDKAVSPKLEKLSPSPQPPTTKSESVTPQSTSTITVINVSHDEDKGTVAGTEFQTAATVSTAVETQPTTDIEKVWGFICEFIDFQIVS